MAQLKIYFQLIRYPNLLIIAATMYLLEYFLMPACHLHHFYFFLFTLVPVTAAAAGYIINDIADRKIDQINKPEKLIIGNMVSSATAWTLYGILVLVSLSCATILVVLHQTYLLFLYISLAATFLLAFYPYILKPLPLIGNIVVAALSAMIPVLVALYNAKEIAEDAVINDCIATADNTRLLGAYILLAFYTSLLREMTKDMEDLEGDRQGKAYTLPVLTGITASKIVTLMVAIGLPIVMHFIFRELVQLRILLVIFFVSALPFFYYLIRAKTKKDFSRASLYLKISMLVGLLAIPVLHYIHL